MSNSYSTEVRKEEDDLPDLQFVTGNAGSTGSRLSSRRRYSVALGVPRINEGDDVLFVDEAAQMCLAAADAHRVQCLLGYNGMNPSRLGMRTFGSVSAFIASFSPMILLSAST